MSGSGYPTSQPYNRASLLAKLTGAAIVDIGSFLVGQGTSQLASTGSGLTYLSNVLAASGGTSPSVQSPTAWSAGAGVLRTGTQLRTDGTAADSILTAGGITMSGALSGVTTITASSTVAVGVASGGNEYFSIVADNTNFWTTFEAQKVGVEYSPLRLNPNGGAVTIGSGGLTVSAGVSCATLTASGTITGNGANGLICQYGSVGNAFLAIVTGDTSARFVFDHNGGMAWGSGAASRDVTLTRSAAGVLSIGGALTVSGAITHAGTNTSSGSTAGRLAYFGGSSGDGAGFELRGSTYATTPDTGYLRVASTYVGGWTGSLFFLNSGTSLSIGTSALLGSERVLISGGGTLPAVGATQIALSAGGIACGAGVSCATLSASGTITLAGKLIKNCVAATGTEASLVTGSTTGAAFHSVVNTGGTLYFGVDRSIGGYIATGTSAYSTVISALTATALHLCTTSIARLTIAATGEVAIASTTEATTGGAGALTTAGGIYAAKKIITATGVECATLTLSGKITSVSAVPASFADLAAVRTWLAAQFT